MFFNVYIIFFDGFYILCSVKVVSTTHIYKKGLPLTREPMSGSFIISGYFLKYAAQIEQYPKSRAPPISGKAKENI